jgi:hypothetical protein
VAFVLVTLYTVPTKHLQGLPENLFHLLLGVPALAIVLLELRSARSHVPERG